MYTNIDVDHSIAIIHAWFEAFTDELPPNIPTILIMKALEIVMKNNIFTFGDTYWIQTKGTAMGTPCACMIASIYFAYHERLVILKKYSKHIVFYKRFIDDVFCLWHDDTTQDPMRTITFDEFKKDMNNFGSLKWEFEPLTLETTFLDLRIKLSPKPTNQRTTQDFYSLQFSSYQKPMNLYLYIPPHSSHPPGITRSIIHSQLRKYWFQNTNKDDFQNITKAFFQRLQDRGHNPLKLQQIFLETATKLDTPLPDYQPNDTSLDHRSHHPRHHSLSSPPKTTDLYLKWRFHPNDIAKTTIRRIYKQTCESITPTAPLGFRELPTDNGSTMTINKLTVAYTRDKNLRDLLIPS